MSNNKIVYGGKTFTDETIQSVQMHHASSLLYSQLEANTITAVVKTSDETIQSFVRNTPMRYYHKDRQRMVAYVQSIDRIGPELYQIYGTSAIGLLMEREHKGGLYNGQTAETVIKDITGNIPVEIKSNLKGIKLYGWLPYSKPPEKSARDNLVQVLFAISAALKTDLDGVLRIQPLWDGVSGSVEWNRIYEDGAKAQRSGAISAVSVTEHNYISGGEDTKLFEGTALTGDIITFSEPMSNLSASGFSILERGVNYAKLSAGTGTLTGKKYIHNTRQVTRTVTAGAPENVKTIDDATLVSFFNSNSVADSVAEYYKHTEVIDCSVVLDTQSPGDVLNVYHPYTKKAAPACVESLDITASGILKASMKALVGYKPPQTVDIEYFDKRQVFTSNTSFTVPAGVHNIRVVLIGGGQGGQGGYRGSTGGSGGTAESRSVSGTTNGAAGKAGSGGAAGSGGSGGKIYIVDLDVEPGDVITISIGSGGTGGASGGRGSDGGNTTVTINGVTYSSGSGSANSAGYTDPQTGQVYAKPGSAGKAGADGGDGGSGYGSSGESGNSTGGYSGGNGGNISQYVKDRVDGGYTNTTFVEFYIAAGGGGGAAIGNNGGNANNAASGSGASASGSGSSPSAFGSGGGGGNGGGGGGGGGGGILIKTVTGGSGYGTLATQAGGGGGSGGAGSRGGTGRQGGAIFYYAEAKEAPSGSPVDTNYKLFIDKFGRILTV